jgi:hypothetical protein
VASLLDSSIFTAAIADPRFAAAVAISALSGLVRGFSGFGSAMIYMPLIAAVYEPRIAGATLLLIDFVASSPTRLSYFSISFPNRSNDNGARSMLDGSPQIARARISPLTADIVSPSTGSESGRHGRCPIQNDQSFGT